VFGFPSIVRFSWKTCKDKLEKHKELLDWKDVPIETKAWGKVGTSNGASGKQQTLSMTFKKKETAKSNRTINVAIKKANLRRELDL